MTTTAISVSATTTSTTVVSANISRESLSFRNTDINRLYLSKGISPAAEATAPYYLDQGDTMSVTGSDAREAWYVIWTANGGGALVGDEVTNEALAGPGSTTILGVIQSVCKRPLGIEPPDAVFSSTDRTPQELAEVANAALDMIVRAYSWRSLVQRATYTGDGTTQDFDLPDDYARMLKDQRVWSSDTQNPFQPVTSLDDWMAMDVRNFNPGVNGWIIYGGQMHFTPALDDAEVAQHYYQSTAAVQPASGTAKSRFTADTDTFRLNDELLKKAIIYLWKQDKGHPYGEFMNDYEALKERLVLEDKGARALVIGSMRIPNGVSIAYPSDLPGGS